MITKTFSAQTGAGIRKLVVAPAALGMGRRITVITPSNVVFNTNWSRALPNATGIGPLQWLRRAVDADTDLIIVDCIHAIMMDRIRATLESIRAEVWVIANGDEDLAPLTRQRALEGMKRLGIISDLEDLSITLGADALAAGNAIHEKIIARFPMARVNGGGSAGPDVTGIAADGRVVEGDLIPAAPKLTADQIRSIMAYFGVPQQQPRQSRDWTIAPRFDVIMGGVPCATHAKTGDFAARRAEKRNIALVTSHIQSIAGDELDQLLAPYIAAGLLRTIYAESTRATEYRGPSGKLIAITIGRNHYRHRDAVLGGSPALYAQWIGRIQRVLPTGDQIRESSAGAGKSVVIPFPDNGAGR